MSDTFGWRRHPTTRRRGEVSISYTDQQIREMLAEHKQPSVDTCRPLSLTRKRIHNERNLDLQGDSGAKYRLILRQNTSDPLDFSVILARELPRSGDVFRLRRHNGKGHEHKNKIEGDVVYDHHIHYATERYQKRGFDEDGYAEATDRYSTIEEAVDCMIKSGNITILPAVQRELFWEPPK